MLPLNNIKINTMWLAFCKLHGMFTSLPGFLIAFTHLSKCQRHGHPQYLLFGGMWSTFYTVRWWLLMEGLLPEWFVVCCGLNWASLVAQRLKPLPAMWETWVRSLGGESHGQRSLVGYNPRSRKESDTTERFEFLAGRLSSSPVLVSALYL